MSANIRQSVLYRVEFKGVGIMNEEEKKMEEKRNLFETLINSWDGSEMWYQERRIQFPGIVKITTDKWGVSVTIKSEHYRDISLSGRWDILFVGNQSLGAMYCGWTINKDIIHPELGISIG